MFDLSDDGTYQQKLFPALLKSFGVIFWTEILSENFCLHSFFFAETTENRNFLEKKRSKDNSKTCEQTLTALSKHLKIFFVISFCFPVLIRGWKIFSGNEKVGPKMKLLVRKSKFFTIVVFVAHSAVTIELFGA